MKSFKPNENFKYYLDFLSERMDIFWKRYFSMEPPYTENPIFNEYKFTNVYRSLDRVSQFLLGDVIYDEVGMANDWDSEDIFIRTILFKHFNKIETWLSLEKEFGKITSDIKFDDIDRFLTELSKKETIYSNAYMMTASFMKNGKIMGDYKIKENSLKHSAYLQIWKSVINSGKMYDIMASKSLAELQGKLNEIITVGGFLSMQYAIDLNYSQLFHFDENEHIIAGPGAQRGIERTFTIEGRPDYIEIIKWVTKELPNLLYDYGFEFSPLPGREPKLIDIQNCFCETDKYLRGLGVKTEGVEVEGKRIKNYFKPKSENIKFVFPPKWNIDF
jgi:hypothetical protein